MTDKVTFGILLDEFDNLGGTLRHSMPIKKTYIKDVERETDDNRYKWRVVEERYLPNSRGTHCFRVAIEIRGNTKRLRIDGSIRKWLLGKTSVEDITKKQLSLFVKELAERLCLSDDIVWDRLIIYNTEIGYNFFTNLRWEDFVKHCVQYGRTKERIDYDNRNECLYWNGDDKSLKMYNKSKEMPANINNQALKSTAENIVSNLKSKGLTLCRIEVTFDDKHSFQKYGLSQISTLRDIYRNWYNLHLLLTKEIAKIMIESKVYISENMSLRQREIAQIINKSWTSTNAVKRLAKEFYNSDENRARRQVYAIMNEYSSPKDYSIRAFRKTIAKRLIWIDRNREKLPLNDLFHILWRTNKGRKLKLNAI